MAIRAYTLDELIEEFDATRRRKGRRRCPVTEGLAIGRALGASFDQAQQWLMTEAGPMLCREVMLEAHRFNTPEAAEEIEIRWGTAMLMYGWDQVRVIVEMLLHEHAHDLSPGALALFVGEIRDKHPNPDGFLAQIGFEPSTPA